MQALSLSGVQLIALLLTALVVWATGIPANDSFAILGTAVIIFSGTNFAALGVKRLIEFMRGAK
jgi:hypothetical protein